MSNYPLNIANVSVNAAVAKAEALAAQAKVAQEALDALKAQIAASPSVTPIKSHFIAGHAYKCVTSDTSQFTVGEIYMGVRTGKISEMDPNTGVVSNHARVFNVTRSSFIDIGQWCDRPTRKVN